MIQQTLAVSTAFFFSLSLIPYGTPWTTTWHTVTTIASHSDQGGEEQSWKSEQASSIGDRTLWPIEPSAWGLAWFTLGQINLGSCRVTQSEDSHHTKEGGHSFALDVACIPWVSYNVKAPNYKPYYVLAYIGEDERLGDYVVLRHWEERWIFWHTKSSRNVWDKILPQEIIWASNDSWHATGIHTHIEHWKGSSNTSLDWARINEFSLKLCTQREWAFCQKKTQISKKTNTGLQKYYFTHYDLGDVNQNDSAPCHWASGADLCFLAREGVNTMALTVDIRNKLGVKWWDKVILEWDAWCRWIYEVHDEMAPRFRTSCKKRPGTNYCIKWDLPGKPGGACTVQKIKY